MPRSRGSDIPQRPSPRGPHQLRMSSSDSDPPHHRPVADRSPKLGDRRSPRGTQSDTINQKKLGTRIADLESQLGQAQDELKVLKEQLASAEAAKKVAQDELEKKTKKPIVPKPVAVKEKHPPSEIQESNETNDNPDEVLDENLWETDVFEVPIEKVTVESTAELKQPTNEEEKEGKPIDISTELFVADPDEVKKQSSDDLASKDEEINTLKARLEEKVKELEVFGQENESLKKQLNESALDISAAQKKEEETALKLRQMEEKLEASKASTVQLEEKLKGTEEAKEALEAEMKKLRVQTEQWRKAADAAAAILAGGVEIDGRIPERCGSMDKQFGSIFEPPSGGYAGYVGSPGLADDSDDGFGSGKKKGSGIRMFGDLWKKKGHK